MNPDFISIIVVAVILVFFLIKRSVQKNRKWDKRQVPRTHSTGSKTTPSRTKNSAAGTARRADRVANTRIMCGADG